MSDVAVGDIERAFLEVTPADLTTAVTLTARPPAGLPFAVTVTAGPLETVPGGSDQRRRWTSDPITYSAPGRWVLHWEITGIGEGAEDAETYVVPSPVAGGPTWLPGRSRVANYVTHRTLARNPAAIVNSQAQYVLTFDSTTTPTGIQADAIIADMGSWVAMRVAPLPAAMHDVARTVTALAAAAAIERQFKADEDSLQRANDMERRMEALLADLVDAANTSNGTDDYGVDVAHLPVYSFPPADCRWDSPSYW
ncbi:hypothetical protein Ade02nite_19730 [Paractinoplanes deccanensis]|uniref:Uncharacterized protein n=1 Tax=Paractinoplanes deccanensis TaxID=113561 RepID=A0ABQ3Y027_9ACTN|nr:hypothetical protein [Actinoplanes deccanensis]GID73332.1 hypothetical protein Ade02nite_19730 [Actinoplanes deccanensis]